MEDAQEASLKLLSEGPPIFQAELAAFFQNHFSAEAVANFGQTFQNAAAFQQTFDGAEMHDYAEEDDLGYYDDGVKRTLTDEQIEMFRVAELRELRRKRERAQPHTPRSTKAQDESSDEANNSQPSRQGSGLPSSARVSKKKKRGNMKPRYEPKPDLRKRTWDVVEPGLDTLEYD